MTAVAMGLLQTVLVFIGVVVIEGDTQVDCVFGRSCVLPCRFQTNTNTIIHWVKTSGELVKVHSYYKDQDQLEHLDPLYKGRTSLFLDQISGGNASLCLTRVNLQDQGRYLCYTSTSQKDQETTVTLTVRAPVARVSRVDIVLMNNTVTCKSGGIYPRPELTWSVSPPPDTVLQSQTKVRKDDQGLYDISSSLRTVYGDTESTYSCSVQNEHSARKATIRQHPPMESAPNSEVSLPCDASGLYDITWTFNHNQTILSKPAGEEEAQVGPEWQQHVRGLSESGGLLLTVTSSESEGTYRCILSDKDETHVTDIELKILDRGSGTHWRDVPTVIILTILIISIITIIIIIILRLYVKKRRGQSDTVRCTAPQSSCDHQNSALCSA